MRLDRAGVDYIIEVAKDAGFGVTVISTHEDVWKAPEVTLTFIQKRDPAVTVDPAAGVTEDQAKQIAQVGMDAVGPNVFSTLDD